jgi:hypothetical protein
LEGDSEGGEGVLLVGEVLVVGGYASLADKHSGHAGVYGLSLFHRAFSRVGHTGMGRPRNSADHHRCSVRVRVSRSPSGLRTLNYLGTRLLTA